MTVQNSVTLFVTKVNTLKTVGHIILSILEAEEISRVKAIIKLRNMIRLHLDNCLHVQRHSTFLIKGAYLYTITNNDHAYTHYP